MLCGFLCFKESFQKTIDRIFRTLYDKEKIREVFALRRTVSIVTVAACTALIVGLFVWTRSFRTAPSEYASAVPVSGVTWQVQPDQTQLDWSMYNESGADLLFGEQMALEYRKDGTWVEVLTRLSRRASERSYTAMGRECPNGGSTQGTFSLNEYPALRAGIYRLVIPLDDGQALFSQSFTIS